MMPNAWGVPKSIRSIRTPDGLDIAVYESGPCGGPAVLFVHGFSQSHMVWMAQFGSPALQHCRLIAYDLRGHGLSSKPRGAHFYKSPRRWAEEFRAVMDTLEINRPVIVAWSLGASLFCHYLARFGDSSLRAINFVSARLSRNPSFIGPASNRNKPGLLSEDSNVRFTAANEFLRSFSVRKISHSQFHLLLISGLSTPAHVLRSIYMRRNLDYQALAGVKCPVLITHGIRDKLASFRATEDIVSRIPHANLSLYMQCGHIPFLEDSQRFDAELLQLCRF
jgi:pimeloyl-ACP methyl ester carboxylesterase